MLDSLVRPVLESLTLALQVPVRSLRDLSPEVRDVLRCLHEPLGRPVQVLAGSQAYLACRYHQDSEAVIVLGPYHSAGPVPAGMAEPVLDGPAVERASSALALAARALGRAVEQERQRLELASQLEVVSHSVLALTSALDLEIVLRRIVDLARELAGARYGALSVPDESGVPSSFVTSGISEAQAQLIGEPPCGRGILGLLLSERKTIRLANLTEHPASVGFPPHHPPMRSFLGVPIVSRGQLLGNLYLTEKILGPEFTESDARQVELLARHAAVAIENARLYQAVEDQQRRLQSLINQLPEAVLLLETEPERLSLANQQASRLLGWPIEAPLPLDDFLSHNPRVRADGTAMPTDEVHIVRSLREGAVVERSEVRVARPDGRELSMLVNSAPLRAQNGKIVGAVAVFQDITEIKDAEQLKDDFLSLVSHELRTPLTTVQAGALLLRNDWDQVEDDVRRAVLEDVVGESRRLGSLIENMVQLANIRAGRLGLQAEPVLVESLARRTAAGFDQITPGQSISLRFEPRLIANADPALIEQTLRILLQNAVKYAPGSAIEISGRRRLGQVVLGVRDHGPGIDEDELPLVFDRFQRGGRRRDVVVPGLGLGLYLARHLVQANGGDIWIESPVDGGANVLFSLPAEADEPE